MTSFAGRSRAVIGLARTGLARGAAAFALLGLYFVIARTFSPSEAGRFFVFLTLASVCAPVLVFGLNQYLVRTLPTLASREQAAVELRAAFRVQLPLTAALAGAVLVGALLGVISVGDSLALVAVVLVVPAFSLFGFWHQGLRQFEVSILILGIANYAFIGAVVYATDRLELFTGDPRTRIGVSMLAGSIATLFLAVALSRSVFSRPAVDLPASQLAAGWQYLNKDVAVFWVISLLVVVNNWLPQLLFYAKGSHQDYADFTLSQNLANMVTFFVIVSNIYLAPHVSEMYHEGRHADLSALYVRTTKIMCAICIPVVVVLIVASRPILRLFGDTYVAGAPVLIIVTLVQFVNVATGSSNTVLMMTHNHSRVFRAMLVALSIGAIALLPSLWRPSALGFALALAAILVTQNLLTFREMQRTVGIDLSALLPWRRRAPSEPVQSVGHV